MSIVANSSPIIVFAKTNNLSILRAVVKTLIIPSAVYKEIMEGRNQEEIADIIESSWIKLNPTDVSHEAELLSKNLGPGEKEAIILAKRLSLPILMDDLRARKEAKRLGLRVIGSLGIIYIAKKTGLIKSVKEFLDSFVKAGYYISDALYSTFLKEVGEIE